MTTDTQRQQIPQAESLRDASREVSACGAEPRLITHP